MSPILDTLFTYSKIDTELRYQQLIYIFAILDRQKNLTRIVGMVRYWILQNLNYSSFERILTLPTDKYSRWKYLLRERREYDE